MASSGVAAKYWLQQAVNALEAKQGDRGLSLEAVEHAVKKSRRNKILLGELLSCQIPNEGQLPKHHQCNDKPEVLLQQKQREGWLEYVKSQKQSLRDGTAHPRLLFDLATQYLGKIYVLEEDVPLKRFLIFLDDDEELLDSAVKGLRRSIDHVDVPTVEEILNLGAQSKKHLLGRPCLAGMVENTRHNPDFVLQLDEKKLQIIIAFHLTENDGVYNDWFGLLIEHKPQVIAEVLSHCVSVILRQKSHNIATAHSLVRKIALDRRYEQVARLVAPAMLKSFPVRCNSEQLRLLHGILIATFFYLDRDSLLGQIQDKLRASSMNTAQRICWLVVELVINPKPMKVGLARNYKGARFVFGIWLNFSHTSKRIGCRCKVCQYQLYLFS